MYKTEIVAGNIIFLNKKGDFEDAHDESAVNIDDDDMF